MNEQSKPESLDEMFEDVAAKQRRLSDDLDENPFHQAKMKAKREAEIRRQIAAGIRDENGDWIEDEENEDE